ncbi:predicted protein [Nematostella vectensis]|uniref:Formin GTPase-binding domain-containing protein n=1 Tax=Nematostella vectensis TaxID=45351 RepID=A7SLR4_NEMVE|nr:predicted protein [Nematostella vectensis]|eukprot:XP_001627445.1 predicted protein [Nematostella vectensis]
MEKASWGKAKKLATSAKAKQIEYGNFEDIDPELCVKLLSIPSLKNFSSLHCKLKTCTEQWLKDFVAFGGLSILFGSLECMSSRKLSFLDAFAGLECVRCVKEVMNSEAGLTAMLDSSDLVCQLARGLLDHSSFSHKKTCFHDLKFN